MGELTSWDDRDPRVVMIETSMDILHCYSVISEIKSINCMTLS